MGGRGIKSCKRHFRRVMSKTPRVFEELSTICCQVGDYFKLPSFLAIKFGSYNDLNSLTPAKHLTAEPDEDVTDIFINR